MELARKLDLWKYGNMKTTLEIPNSLFKRVKARAAMEQLKLKDIIASALNDYLRKPRRAANGKKCPFPLVRGKGGPLIKRMNNETVANLEAEEELERYRRSFGR
jgi:hypothetical protein